MPALTLGAALLLGFERLWPGMTEARSDVMSFVTFVAFLVRTFEFHLGIGLLALTSLCVLLRARRSALACVVLSVLALWATARQYVPSQRDALSPSRGAAMAASNGGATRAADAQAEPPRPLRVLSANILMDQGDLQALLAEIRRLDPDVICFVEHTTRSDSFFRQAIGDDYPFHVRSLAAGGAYGQGVFSRLPFVDQVGRTRAEAEATQDGDAWQADIDLAAEFLGPQIRVVVRHDGRRVGVRAVHLMSPGEPRLAREQRHEVRRLVTLVEDDTERLDGLVLAGDFNSTPESAQHAMLRRAGLTESAQALGLGREPTWPRITALRHFPNIRIDHVMATPPLRFVNAGRTADFGSDHRGVWADVTFAADPAGNRD